MPNDATTLTDQNIADIRWMLGQPGCPQLPEWLYLSKGPDESVFLIFEEDSDHNLVEDNWIRHDPAALNTVAVWLLDDVHLWLLKTDEDLFERAASKTEPVTPDMEQGAVRRGGLRFLSAIRAELEGGGA